MTQSSSVLPSSYSPFLVLLPNAPLSLTGTHTQSQSHSHSQRVDLSPLPSPQADNSFTSHPSHPLLPSPVQFSHSVVSTSLQPHGLQQARLPCPSPTPRVFSNSCPLSRWCHPTISSSIVPFSSSLQSFPASGSFPVSQFFSSVGQNIGASASVLPMNIQDWFP